MLTELSLSSGHIEIYMCITFRLPHVFLFVSDMHILACPLYNVLLEVVLLFVVRPVTEFHLSAKFHVCYSEYTIMLATHIHSTTVLCVHTCPFIMYWPRLFARNTMFTELSL